MLRSAKDFADQPEKYYLELDKNISFQNINCNKELLKKAYYFSFERHNNQFRDSGEPFASHPYAVAKILVDLKLSPFMFLMELLPKKSKMFLIVEKNTNRKFYKR